MGGTRAFACHCAGWANGELAKGMNGWRRFVQLHVMAEAEQASRDAEEKVKQQRIRNIIMRLRNRQADMALQKWKQCIANTKRQRALVERAARRVRMRAAASAWTAWDEQVRLSPSLHCQVYHPA